MTVYGFHASREQISPRQLLTDVQLAEQVGFEAAMCSDHIEPRTQRQGHSGMAWPWLGAALGTGQYANEHVTGEAWPRKEVRQQRLEECAEIISRLLEGETVSHDGLVRIDQAALWEVPDPKPRMIASAVTAQTAVRGANWADRLATLNKDPETLRHMVDQWDEAGGADHKILQIRITSGRNSDRSWRPSASMCCRSCAADRHQTTRGHPDGHLADP